jgi:hypothetical protein
MTYVARETFVRAMTRGLVWFVVSLGVCLLLVASAVRVRGASSAPVDFTPSAYVYLPLVESPECPASSSNEYTSGVAYQWDIDDPVRPAWNHADKNLALRSYTVTTPVYYGMVWYNYGQPHAPPQFSTMFSPDRIPSFVGYYKVHWWNWAPSPDPGTRGIPDPNFAVTALGFGTTRGEQMLVPESGFDLGGGMEAMVIFADEDSITLRYTRGDSACCAGFTLHVDNICTDPNLLALYNSLDAPGGPRYQYPNSQYSLPNLPAGKPFGTARDTEVVVAIADAGCFLDPRSCQDFWQDYTGPCPHHEGASGE